MKLNYHLIRKFTRYVRYIKKFEIKNINISNKYRVYLLLFLLVILLQIFILNKLSYRVSDKILIIIIEIIIYILLYKINKKIEKIKKENKEYIDYSLKEYSNYIQYIKLKYEEEKYAITKLGVYFENSIFDYDIENKNSVCIGKINNKLDVDIDLSNHEYSHLVSKIHGIFNKIDGKWYYEDMNSQNGSSIKRKDNEINIKLESNKKYEVLKGDEIYISLVRLVIK